MDWCLRLLVMTAVVLSAGCASAPEPETVVEVERVKVPVLVKPDPPDYLLAPLIEKRPEIFVPADHEDVRWGVTREGMREFRLLIEVLANRNEQWRDWAVEDGSSGRLEHSTDNREAGGSNPPRPTNQTEDE